MLVAQLLVVYDTRDYNYFCAVCFFAETYCDKKGKTIVITRWVFFYVITSIFTFLQQEYLLVGSNGEQIFCYRTSVCFSGICTLSFFQTTPYNLTIYLYFPIHTFSVLLL